MMKFLPDGLFLLTTDIWTRIHGYINGIMHRWRDRLTDMGVGINLGLKHGWMDKRMNG